MGLKKSKVGVWTVGLKWYSVMNQESALAKALILELFYVTILTKHIQKTIWKKCKFPKSFIISNSILVGKGKGKGKYFFNNHVYMEISDNFLIPSIKLVWWWQSHLSLNKRNEIFSSGKSYNHNEMPSERIAWKNLGWYPSSRRSI